MKAALSSLLHVDNYDVDICIFKKSQTLCQDWDQELDADMTKENITKQESAKSETRAYDTWNVILPRLGK